MFMETVHRKMYAEVPLLMEERELKDLVRLFLRFLEEVPEELKRQVHFKSPWYRGSASGYCDARIKDGKDKKEYFHWTRALEKELAYQELLQNPQYPSAGEFFAMAKYIFGQSEEMARRIFAGPMRQFYDRCFDKNGKIANGFLRVLCYTPTTEPFRAKAHYDKGHGTIALLESSPGLRISCCEKHIDKPVRRLRGKALFMPGQLVWEDTRGDIIPAWHDVIPCNGAEPISSRCARYAVVFFINDKDGRYPELEDTHTPLPVHDQFPVHLLR